MSDQGSFTLIPGWVDDIISMEGHGIWSEEQARDCFARLSRIVSEARRVHGRVRMLVDMRAMEPQSGAVATIIRTEAATLYTMEDKVALLMSPGLQRLQIDAMTYTADVQMCDDPFAALRWLEDS